MKTEHTPTPWEYDTSDKYCKYGTIRRNGMMIAQCHPLGFPSHGTQDGNGAFIVTACNSYDALVEAAQSVLREWHIKGKIQDTYHQHVAKESLLTALESCGRWDRLNGVAK